jgi:hypothetical protein
VYRIGEIKRRLEIDGTGREIAAELLVMISIGHVVKVLIMPNANPPFFLELLRRAKGSMRKGVP